MRLSRSFARWVNGGGGAHIELGTDPFPSVDPVTQDPRPDNIAVFRWRYERDLGRRLIAAFKAPAAPCPAMYFTVFVWDSLSSDWLQITSKLADPDRPERFDLVDVLPDASLSSRADRDSFETYVAIVATPQVGPVYPDGEYLISSGVDLCALSEKDVVEAVQAALGGTSVASTLDELLHSTNTHSSVMETWRTVRATDGYIRSIEADNYWTANAWLLTFDGSVLPPDGTLSVRNAIPVLAADVGGKTWQASTGPFVGGCVCALSTTHPQLTAILLQPTITGDGGELSFLAPQGLRGISNTNTDTTTGPATIPPNGFAYLYGEVTVDGLGAPTLQLYTEAAHTHLVAHGSRADAAGGTLTLVADNASLVTGDITISAGAVAHPAVVLQFDTGATFDCEAIP